VTTITKAILFSLEQCMKCQETKELISGRNDIEIVTFPHDVNKWRDEDYLLAKSYNVFEDLQKTAPILWLDGEKKVGYLRIRKWIQDTPK
jgi:glutaredoxin